MANPPAAPRDRRAHGQLRASDADRELVAETLRRAAGDGRLTPDELDQRLEAALTARSYAELEKLTGDLPPAEGLVPVGGSVPAPRFGGHPTSRFGIALMSCFGRSGRWVVPRSFTGLVIMGAGTIDMRNASFAEQTTRITVLALMGGIDIVVPENAEVRAHGLGILGAFGGRRAGAGRGGTQVIVVTGLAIMGGIGIRRRPPKKDRGGGVSAADAPGS